MHSSHYLFLYLHRQGTIRTREISKTLEIVVADFAEDGKAGIGKAGIWSVHSLTDFSLKPNTRK